MRVTFLYLFCLTLFTCSNSGDESEVTNDFDKTIFNNDLEGSWLSVDYVNTFSKTKSINETCELNDVWSELTFSQKGQLKTHKVGGGPPVSYRVDTNSYIFFDKKFAWDSGGSSEFHYDTVKYEIADIINDTLYILQDNKETLKYIRFQFQNNSFSPFPSAWTSLTNQWLSGKYKFSISYKEYDLVLKEKKNEMEGFENYSHWSFYSEFDQDIVLFRSTPQMMNEDWEMDEFYFVIDSSTSESIYLTQIVTPDSGGLKSINTTNNKGFLKRKS